MNARHTIAIAVAVGLTTALPILTEAADGGFEAKTVAIIKRDYRDRGIALAERVKQDELQGACSKFEDNPPARVKLKLERAELRAIQWPADGKYMGDWKAGEELAQSGKGLTWSDKPGEPAGGNCYNCHQITAKEISFGTIGPSLLHYGKIRGNTEEVQRNVYARIYNAKAYNACAKMPRFGHKGILTEAQIKDLVALLLDPQSPVNLE
jgi:sulfur-oxidizing protein SoxX